MDIPYYGPESLTQLLDAYGTRFQLFEDLRILRLRREELFQDPGRQKSIRDETKEPPQTTADAWSPGTNSTTVLPRGTGVLSYVSRSPEDSWKEISLPPNVEDIQETNPVLADASTSSAKQKMVPQHPAPMTSGSRLLLGRSNATSSAWDQRTLTTSTRQRDPTPRSPTGPDRGIKKTGGIFRQDSSR